MGQGGSTPKSLNEKVSDLRDGFGRLNFDQQRDLGIIANFEMRLDGIEKELRQLIADGKVDQGDITVDQLIAAMQELADTLDFWRGIAEQRAARGKKQYDPATGEELEPVKPDLLSIIEPGSKLLDDDFHVWNTILNATPEELQAAGRRVKVYHRDPNYKGLYDWLVIQIRTYSKEQIEQFEQIVATKPADDPFLTEIYGHLNALDLANSMGKGKKFEQDSVMQRDFTGEEKIAQDKIAEASFALFQFVEENGNRFGHIKIDGKTLRQYILDAMQKGECNNALVATIRRYLKTDYTNVPRFVKIFTKLNSAGYFKESGESGEQ